MGGRHIGECAIRAEGLHEVDKSGGVVLDHEVLRTEGSGVLRVAVKGRDVPATEEYVFGDDEPLGRRKVPWPMYEDLWDDDDDDTLAVLVLSLRSLCL